MYRTTIRYGNRHRLTILLFLYSDPNDGAPASTSWLPDSPNPASINRAPVNDIVTGDLGAEPGHQRSTYLRSSVEIKATPTTTDGHTIDNAKPGVVSDPVALVSSPNDTAIKSDQQRDTLSSIEHTL